jgi:acyl-CoA thioesterase FadM
MRRVQIEYPETTLFTHDVPIRITDLNYGNHLGHDTLVSILHDARAQFFRHYDMKESDTDGCGMMIADLEVSYRAEVFFGQVLRVDVAVANLRSRGCDLFYRAADRESGRIVALARTGIVFFDLAGRQLVKIPARFEVVVRAARTSDKSK